MRHVAILTLLLSLTLAGACNQQANEPAAAAQQQPIAQSANLSPEQLGEIGAQIRKNPDRADQLLGQHGLTQESFEKAIRNVTEDPDESRRYAAAYKKASA
jgi:hypothetical protein